MSTAAAQQATFDLAGRTPSSVWSTDWSLADLQHHLGGVPTERIRLVPPPGYATVRDLVQIAASEDGCTNWKTAYWWRRRWDGRKRF